MFRQSIGVGYMDDFEFRKTYDPVWHEGLFTKLSALKIKGSFPNIIKDVL